MKKADFKKVLKWAKERGYSLSPKLDYKTVNGIGGLYATEDIEPHELLYRGPGCVLDTHSDMKNGMTFEYLADIVREYKKGKDSDIYPIFLAFETIENLRNESIYFATPDELNTLGRITKSGANMAVRYQTKIQEITLKIEEMLGDGFTKDDILFVVLNSERRGWGDGGFNPILDLFNHNNLKALSRSKIGKNDYVLGSKMGYKKGDQVYNSYGVHDVYHFIESYGFFDPSDVQVIDIGLRFDFGIADDIQRAHFEELQKHFSVTHFDAKNDESAERYKLMNASAYLSQVGPSPALVKLVDIVSRSTEEELETPGRTPKKNFAVAFMEWVNLIDSTTTPELVDESELTPKLIPYYQAAQREKLIIESNKNWLNLSGDLLPMIGAREFAQKIINSNLENQK